MEAVLPLNSISGLIAIILIDSKFTGEVNLQMRQQDALIFLVGHYLSMEFLAATWFRNFIWRWCINCATGTIMAKRLIDLEI